MNVEMCFNLTDCWTHYIVVNVFIEDSVTDWSGFRLLDNKYLCAVKIANFMAVIKN